MKCKTRELLSTSEIAKLTAVSKDTLKHYNKIGLFQPDCVDPVTGYKYYSYDQVCTLGIIRDMRMLDIPIKDIQYYISNMHVDKSIDFLESKVNEITQQIEQLTRVNNLLKSRLNRLRAYSEIPKKFYDFHQKNFSDRYILTMGGYLETDFDHYYQSNCIENLLNINSPGFLGEPLGAFVPMELSGSNLSKRMIAFAFINNPNIYPSEYIKLIKGGDYLCLLVNEGIRGYIKQIESIQDHLFENNLELNGDIIITSLVDEGVTSNRLEMLAEVQIPIKTHI